MKRRILPLLLVLCLLAGGIAALAPAVRSRRPQPVAVRP